MNVLDQEERERHLFDLVVSVLFDFATFSFVNDLSNRRKLHFSVH